MNKKNNPRENEVSTKTMGISLDYDGYGALIVIFVIKSKLVDQIRGKHM